MITSFLNDESDLEDRLSEFCKASQSDQTVKDTVSEILHEIRKTAMLRCLKKLSNMIMQSLVRMKLR